MSSSYDPSPTTTRVADSSANNIGNSVFSFIASPTLYDGLKLFVLGGCIEMMRRVITTSLSVMHHQVVERFYVTVLFDDKDEPFTWMMFWLSKQPQWNKTRSIRVSTYRYGQSGLADQIPGESGDYRDAQTRFLSYVPSYNTPIVIWFRGSWMTVVLTQTPGDMWNRKGDEKLQITMLTCNRTKINDLLIEAKTTYKKESEGRINIFIPDANFEWILTGSRPKRPLSSVVLDKKLKQYVIDDAQDFMKSEKWYGDRGIPWRRGYLLYGKPGTGKTSLIHALAGELKLDIYIISLAKKNMDDTTLHSLISRLPPRSCALIEDIDAAFIHGVSRETGSNVDPEQQDIFPQQTIGVTLSGLLGAIDGVGAQEGRLLFATTNKYSALDPALVRPGRLDVHIKFDNASKEDAKELFKCFYSPYMNDDVRECDGGDLGLYLTASKVPEEPPSSRLRTMVNSDKMVDSQNYELSQLSRINHGKEDTVSCTSSGLEPKLQSSSLTRRSQSTSIQMKQQNVKEEPAQAPINANKLGNISITEEKNQVTTLQCIMALAERFSDQIPEGEFSMAELQGLLMRYKRDPEQVVINVEGWIKEERERRDDRDPRAEKKKTIISEKASTSFEVPEILHSESPTLISCDDQASDM